MIPDSVIEHLKSREGYVNRVYLDSLGNPTAGVGHLLNDAENALYGVGDVVADDVIDKWLYEDSQKAWLAAFNQAKGIDCMDLRPALFHVCYQLGSGWRSIHKKTWAYMRDHEWQKAAIEAADSRWNQQTPVRVIDFQIALLQKAIS